MSKFLNTSGTRKYLKLDNSFNSTDAPDVQIAKLLEEQKKMKDGDDLRTWSLSARKALKEGRSVAIIVPNGEKLTS